MPGETGRRFTLADAMILVAALASATLVVRQFEDEPLSSSLRYLPAFRVLSVAPLPLLWLIPFAAIGTVGYWLVRLRVPRPGLGELRRQPGSLAAGVSAAVILAASLLLPPRLASRPGLRVVPIWVSVYMFLPALIGPGVVLAWLTLRARHRPRRRRDWVEWLGIVLGWYWIVACVLLAWLPMLVVLIDSWLVPESNAKTS